MRTLNGFVPRNLAVRKARTLLTALGIALGVAAMVATDVVHESATYEPPEGPPGSVNGNAE